MSAQDELGEGDLDELVDDALEDIDLEEESPDETLLRPSEARARLKLTASQFDALVSKVGLEPAERRVEVYDYYTTSVRFWSESQISALEAHPETARMRERRKRTEQRSQALIHELVSLMDREVH